jgi:hypothetical protein
VSSLGDVAEGLDDGSLERDRNAAPIAGAGDVFQLGAHRIVCGDATDLEIGELLTQKGGRLLIDEPYNVPIAGNVTEGRHREFAMASGEMSAAEFEVFNTKWKAVPTPYICDGGFRPVYRLARLLGRLERGREAEPQSSESNRLDKDRCWHGAPLPIQHELLPLMHSHRHAFGKSI